MRTSLSASAWAFLVAGLAGLAGVSAVACVSSSTDATASSSSEALATLSADEIVGTLAYGQTSAPIAYNDTPRYRAFKFSGNGGDAVSVTVSSMDAHPRAWILAADASNIAYSTTTGAESSAHVTATLPASGTFYVAFRDYFLETGTFTVALSGPPSVDAGVPDAAPSCDPEITNCDGGKGGIVHGTDRTIVLPNNALNAVAETWGKGLWDGYISFTATLHDPDTTDNTAAITDGTGASYPLSNGVSLPFQRLPLPVTLRALKTDSDGASVAFTQFTYEVTATHPIAAQSLRGQYSGTATQSVTSIGTDIPGVSLTVSAAATFFQNFTNGNACDQLLLNGKVLTPSAPSGTFVFTAPLVIQSVSTCVSSALATRQDPTADFALGLSAITVGNPQ